MFENQSLFIMLSDCQDILRVELDRDTQSVIVNLFTQAMSNYLSEKRMIAYDGCYKPERDELLKIDNFVIPENIVYAVDHPNEMDTFNPNIDDNSKIKAFFIGNNIDNQHTIVFQKFQKSQNISRAGINIFYEQNTFRREKRYGLSISKSVDAVYKSNEGFIFSSDFIAKQIFSLSDYYRMATENEVLLFKDSEYLCFEDKNLFESYENDQFIRRKIALIHDSKILKTYSAKQIQTKATKLLGTNIVKTTKGKLIIPKTKKEVKILLKFLDEEMYRGIFSNALLETNSKTKVNLNQ